jgi:selenocysteine lyase/cysteine desulfurase
VPDVAAFRAEFPVLKRLAYFNSGSVGPVPRRALEAVEERMQQEVEEGRTGLPYVREAIRLRGELRARYSELLGCDAAEVALTPSTTDGVNTIISGLDLQAGDVVLTTEEEHPGVLAPLGAARQRTGIEVRVVPWNEIVGAVGDRTRLVVCSHVSWVTGRAIDTASLAATGVSVLLDGAQALGAIPVDVHALGCDFYAASGQKWLCGPEASGCLYVRAAAVDQLRVPWPGYAALADHEAPLELVPQEGAARFDLGFVPGLRSRWALASLEVLGAPGWDWVHERAATLAEQLAGALEERGLQLAPRGRTTLVSWHSDDPDGDVERLAGAGFALRRIPGKDLVRASVGAWATEDELERLTALARL